MTEERHRSLLLFALIPSEKCQGSTDRRRNPVAESMRGFWWGRRAGCRYPQAIRLSDGIFLYHPRHHPVYFFTNLPLAADAVVLLARMPALPLGDKLRIITRIPGQLLCVSLSQPASNQMGLIHPIVNRLLRPALAGADS